ncbi:MAG: 3'(2'),5'-bisphosphate nucleotidase CysQ [Alphaproteobacteria bacterium]|nr:3'(2'),5'-bisphosphate nucleotidase CysQ [Alphaproteobacteria bacterium]
MNSGSKLLSHRAALCNMVRRVAVDAGELILEYADGLQKMEIVSKSDGSPVTQADEQAEKLIEDSLKKILPDIPFIGEEKVAENGMVDKSGSEYFWLVDALDGTREFISGGENYTVNIALVHHDLPVLGVVYAPEKGEIYFGFTETDGEGKAFRFFEDSEKEKPIRVRPMPKEGLVVFSSKHFADNEKMEIFLGNFKIAKVLHMSSSLKICNIAAGKADLYPRLGKTCEWDTAAGDAILRAAGGIIRDLDQNILQYGQGLRENYLNPEFVASSKELFWEKDIF